MTVNHFDTVFNFTCWDMHANGSSLDNTYLDYERHLCPQFDRALPRIDRGPGGARLLEDTVVAVLSEFGRTPKLNNRGGRDHYPPAWPNFFVGGGVKGGQVIGSPTRSVPHHTTAPCSTRGRRVGLHAMGIDLETTMMPGPGSRPFRFIEADPIKELFG
ncbi:MAG: hypothetical protein Ct9H300mP1_09620 [Planctomycetaceae bacterium]|nr:MAG: hypothetical protein Ct9H300mP1_09620 [Planctomycetaceae bacterium]